MHPQRAGSASREARWVSVPQPSQQSISEEEAAVPHPPLLTRSNTNRHSAYFDAMQQLDGAGEQEANIEWNIPRGVQSSSWGSLNTLWGLVRGQPDQGPEPGQPTTRRHNSGKTLKSRSMGALSVPMEKEEYSPESAPPLSAGPSGTTQRRRATAFPVLRVPSPEGDDRSTSPSNRRPLSTIKVPTGGSSTTRAHRCQAIT